METKSNYKPGPDILFAALKKTIKVYFPTKESRTGGMKIYVKTAILMTTWIMLYYLILHFPATGPPWILYGEYVLLGVNFALNGFNVMHDASHGTYSSKKWVNELVLLMHEILQGASAFLWYIKHILLHHAFVNTTNDEDIDAGPVLRLSPWATWHGWHRYQHWYAIPVYGLLYFAWIFLKDPLKFFTRKIKNLKIPDEKFTARLQWRFWLTKIAFIGIMIVTPAMFIGWERAVIGFLILCFTCGVLISIVFQLAHVVESSSYPEVDPNTGTIPHSWSEQQIMETSNFATKNKMLSWLVGGLNFQVEHHLFPKISHVHYPMISKVIKEKCIELGYPYNECTGTEALKSHFSALKELGKKPV